MNLVLKGQGFFIEQLKGHWNELKVQQVLVEELKGQVIFLKSSKGKRVY